jgi:hypothetical protein
MFLSKISLSEEFNPVRAEVANYAGVAKDKLAHSPQSIVHHETARAAI